MDDLKYSLYAECLTLQSSFKFILNEMHKTTDKVINLNYVFSYDKSMMIADHFFRDAFDYINNKMTHEERKASLDKLLKQLKTEITITKM